MLFWVSKNISFIFNNNIILCKIFLCSQILTLLFIFQNGFTNMIFSFLKIPNSLELLKNLLVS